MRSRSAIWARPVSISYALGGLLSSGASIAAAATLITHHEISVETGVIGIVLSSLTSVLTDVPLVRRLACEPQFARRVSWSMTIIATVGIAGIAVVKLLPPGTPK